MDDILSSGDLIVKQKKSRSYENVGKPRKVTDPKSEFGKRLVAAAGSKKISVLTRLFRCSKGAAMRYFTGDVEPPLVFLRNFIEGTNCDGHWLLMGGDREMIHDREVRYEPAKPIPVPQFGRVVAGDPVLFHHNRVGADLQIPTRIGFARVSGDGLWPLAKSGAYLLLLSDRQPRDADVVAIVRHDGTGHVGELRWTEKGLEISTINPTKERKVLALAESEIERKFVVVGVWFG